jgi:hypothetical protein
LALQGTSAATAVWTRQNIQSRTARQAEFLSIRNPLRFQPQIIPSALEIQNNYLSGAVDQCHPAISPTENRQLKNGAVEMTRWPDDQIAR